MPVTPLTGWEGPSLSYSCSDHLLYVFLQYTVYDATLEKHLETSAGAEQGGVSSFGSTYEDILTPLLYEVHWVPVCFQVQLKGLVM